MDQAEEVQDALGRTYNTPEVDDDELAAELDALGDEIALDNDSSYLDDVLKAPEAPSNKPEPEVNKNKVKLVHKCQLVFLKYQLFQDGIPVDEFGLPQIPSQH